MSINSNDPFINDLKTLGPDELSRKANSTETSRGEFYVNIKSHMSDLAADTTLFEKAIDALPSSCLTKELVTPLLVSIKNIQPANRTKILNSLLFHCCGVPGSKALAKYLIEQGAEVNAKNQQGITPLQQAILLKDRNTLFVLLDAGAKVEENDISAFSMAWCSYDAMDHIQDPIQRVILYKKRNQTKADSEIANWINSADPTNLIKALENDDLAQYLLDRFTYSIDTRCKLLPPSEKSKLLNALLLRVSDTDRAATLLELGAEVNAKNEKGETPLDRAIKSGNDELMKKLFESGANEVTTDTIELIIKRKDYPCLISLIASNHQKYLSLLDREECKGCTINTPDLLDKPLLTTACLSENKDLFDAVLLRNPDVNIKVLNSTPFMIACRRKNREMVLELLKKKANVNPSKSSSTLWCATIEMKGEPPIDKELLFILLDAGADINKEDLIKLSDLDLLDEALTHIKDAGRKTTASKILNEIKKEMESAIAAPDPSNLIKILRDSNKVKLARYTVEGFREKIDNRLKTCKSSEKVKLLDALLCEADTAERITYLLDQGADINSKNLSGETVLDRSISTGKEQLVSELIKRGANTTNAETTRRAFDLPDHSIFLTLTAQGLCDINRNDYDGLTLLIEACRTLNFKKAAELLKRGANIETKSKWGQSTLDYAIAHFSGNPKEKEMITLLIEAGARINEMELAYAITQYQNYGKSKDKELILLLIQAGAYVSEESIKQLQESQLLGEIIASDPVLKTVVYFMDKDLEKVDLELEKLIKTPNLLTQALKYLDLAMYIYDHFDRQIDVTAQTAKWDDETKLQILPFLRPEEIKAVIDRIPSTERIKIQNEPVDKLIPTDQNETGVRFPVKAALIQFAHRFLQTIDTREMAPGETSDIILSEAEDLLNQIPFQSLAIALSDPEVQAVLQYYFPVISKGQLKVCISLLPPQDFVNFIRPFSSTVRAYILTCARQDQIQAWIDAGLLLPDDLQGDLKKVKAWTEKKEDLSKSEVNQAQELKSQLRHTIHELKGGLENLRRSLKSKELKITNQKLEMRIHAEMGEAKITLEQAEQALQALEAKLSKTQKTVMDTKYKDPLYQSFITNPVVTLLDCGNRTWRKSLHIYDRDSLIEWFAKGNEATYQDLKAHPEKIQSYLERDPPKDLLEKHKVMGILPVSDRVRNEFLEAACTYDESDAALELIKNGAEIITEEEIDYLLRSQLLDQAVDHLKNQYLRGFLEKLRSYKATHSEVDIKAIEAKIEQRLSS